MGVTLLLASLLAQAPLEPRPDIASLELRLPAHADPKLLDRISGLITIRKGQPLSARAVQRSIENVYATGRFAEVVVRSEPTATAGEVNVIFELTPKLVITEVYVDGNTVLTSAELIALTRLSLGAEFWAERGAQAAEQVRDAVPAPRLPRRRRRAAHRRRRHRGHGGPVHDRGRAHPHRLGRVLPRTLVDSRPPARSSAWRRGDVLDLDLIDRGLDALRARLRAERYFRARVETPVVIGALVMLPVVAGPQYEFVFSGNRRLSDTALKAVLAYDGEEALGRWSNNGSLSSTCYRFLVFTTLRSRCAKPTTANARAAVSSKFSSGEPSPSSSSNLPATASWVTLRCAAACSGHGRRRAPNPPGHPMGRPVVGRGRMQAIFARDLRRRVSTRCSTKPFYTEAARPGDRAVPRRVPPRLR